MLTFKCNIQQKNELEALAYNIADAQYIKIKYGADDPELIQVRKNIDLSFRLLDQLKVPFWVQNSVIIYAEDLNRYKSEYMAVWLKANKNIEL